MNELSNLELEKIKEADKKFFVNLHEFVSENLKNESESSRKHAIISLIFCSLNLIGGKIKNNKHFESEFLSIVKDIMDMQKTIDQEV